MFQHHHLQNSTVRSLIRQGIIAFGGNSKQKIYGQLNCASGKRLHKQNRVFFTSETAAVENHFRPCGNCMKIAYQTYKNGFI